MRSIVLGVIASLYVADVSTAQPINVGFEQSVRPLLARYCLECHSTEEHAGELDLQRYSSVDAVRSDLRTWQNVREMLKSGEMPPEDARQPDPLERKQLLAWVMALLDAEARARSGDPGLVLMRRLSNAEYNYTIRDLTGVDLRPTREFPVDGAAGEGFTNTGQSLVMSPSLLEKYLDAANDIATHAVLLPDRFRFSANDKRPDWSNELVTQIREFYDQYTEGGRLPLARYLEASLAVRDRPPSGDSTDASLERIATERGLSPKYLRRLWGVLNDPTPSLLLDPLRAQWMRLEAKDVDAFIVDIEKWGHELWRFNIVSLSERWLVPRDDLTSSRTYRHPVTPITNGGKSVIYLEANAPAGGNQNATVRWQRPRFEAAGKKPLDLRAVLHAADLLGKNQRQQLAKTSKYLAAAAEAKLQSTNAEKLAANHGVEADVLQGWIDYLRGESRHIELGKTHLTHRFVHIPGDDQLSAWTIREGPLLLANPSDQSLRIEPDAFPQVGPPGIDLPPRSVVVRPMPDQPIAIGWASPIQQRGRVRLECRIADAQPGIGGPVAWSFFTRLSDVVENPLPEGVLQDGQQLSIDAIPWIRIRPGEIVGLVIEAVENDAPAALTCVEFIVHEIDRAQRTWKLSDDLSRNLSTDNPHPDRRGQQDVWHFVQERDFRPKPVPSIIPTGSLVHRWKTSVKEGSAVADRAKLSREIQSLLLATEPPASGDDPNTHLYHHLTSLNGPLWKHMDVETLLAEASDTLPDTVTVPVHRFETANDSPDRVTWDPDGVRTAVPSALELRFPTRLVAGREFVVQGSLEATSGPAANVQLRLTPRTPNLHPNVLPGVPLLTLPDGRARARLQESIDQFQRTFSPAVCYRQIVPLGGVITLSLLHREDDELCRLALNEKEIERLNHLWAELNYVRRAALTMDEGFDMVVSFRPEYESLRQSVRQRAEQFRQELVEAEPRHLNSLMEFAAWAYRRPLEDEEQAELASLYKSLRDSGEGHEAAFRSVLARVLTSPYFLYRAERATPDGPTPVSDFELATRLSYFLWASMPDVELRRVAQQGELHEPSILLGQTRRMLKDERVRGLAVEFAAQWLQIRGFDKYDEKNAELFPSFDAKLRQSIYEETLLFFIDLFSQDRSVLEVLSADHTYLNEVLATHYGIPGIEGSTWRRVDGVRDYSRGGILGMASVLATQSGASRTSPVLRGTWILETLLGERIPKPPPNIPELPDEETDTAGLTVRQLVERHARIPECAHCHNKIDPYGFTLEHFDAIGRYRQQDQAGRPLNTHVQLGAHVRIDGFDGLRDYLVTERKQQFLRHFCRKLLGYALGRSVQLSDEPLLEAMLARLEKQGYRFSAAVETIVTSQQFRFHRGVESDSQ